MDPLFVVMFVAAGVLWFIFGVAYIRYNLGRREPAMMVQMLVLMAGMALILGFTSPWEGWRLVQSFAFFAMGLMIFGWGCTLGRKLLHRQETRKQREFEENFQRAAP